MMKSVTRPSTKGVMSQTNRSSGCNEPITDIDRDLDVCKSQGMAHKGFEREPHGEPLLMDPQAPISVGSQEAENKDGRWANATMPTQEVIIPCPDDQQHVPLYKGWYGNTENEAKFAEDGYPTSNKGGSRLMMMEQH